MERSILHVDMNNFYASVECMLNPTLRDKAIAVCGSVEERHGIVLAKNYKAKAFGVATGDAIWQAKQKCPNLTIVPPHYEQYMKYSRLARNIYERYTDQVEPYGMDECFLDVTGSTGFGTGFEIADEIRRTIKFELGLTVSAGVSYNKIFAKLGSDLKKPDAITCISRDSFKEQIWNLPASDLLGVGRATTKILDNYCIHTIGQLAQCPEDLLKRKLGKNGLMLKAYANGQDHSPVHRTDYQFPVNSIGHGLTTPQDLENNAEVWNIILSLTQDIGHKLRTIGKKAAGVAIYIRDSELHGKQWQCQLTMQTYSSSIIAKEAYLLFERSYNWNLPIRAVTVRAINLVPVGFPEQIQFFSDPVRVEKKEKLETAIEEIRARFGKSSILPATLFQNLKMPTDREVELAMPHGMIF